MQTRSRHPLTIQLETLLNQPFSPSQAMDLVRRGASPNSKNSAGKSLLHLLVESDQTIWNEGWGTRSYSNAALIRELLEIHKAYIHIKDSNKKTPLECLLDRHFDAEQAMLLVNFNAKPTSKNSAGKSLLHILEETNEISYHWISGKKYYRNEAAINELLSIFNEQRRLVTIGFFKATDNIKNNRYSIQDQNETPDNHSIYISNNSL